MHQGRGPDRGRIPLTAVKFDHGDFQLALLSDAVGRHTDEGTDRDTAAKKKNNKQTKRTEQVNN